ncbi:hypothetical protein METH_06640 [Leisingera methylohalidivorans DSM 14336]|uniref:Uncharacterized protein n=1 Tax=Leisingera methylohalidivorans DSM 14336 TaxID=999552 RepID=V9VW01_9RHOB|nr:hypothetical protein METH_06640 [Leisingera methylohalidivorans DSM 14336]
MQRTAKKTCHAGDCQGCFNSGLQSLLETF